MIAIALLTLRELARRRFVLAAVIGTAILVGLTGWGFAYLTHARGHHGTVPTHQQVLQISSALVILVAYLFSFIVAMIAVFLAAPSLAGDIESGVLLPVVTRPLARQAVAGGKVLALGLVVCAYTAASAIAEFTAVRAATGYLPPHPAAAVGFLCLLALTMLAFTAAIATRLPAIASGIVALLLFGFAWMGGIAQSLGAFYGNNGVRDAGTLTQLIFPSDAMWRGTAFQLQPAAMTAAMATSHGWTGPFFVVAPPPVAMLAWAVVWIGVLSFVAARSFALRDL